MTQQEKKYLNAISQAIFDKKGFNILALDVRGISTMTDYYIIAEGTVSRHLNALCNAIEDKMEELQYPLFRIDGQNNGDWIVLDYYDIVIHLFTPELREKYALEELWQKAKIVDVKIHVSSQQSGGKS